MATRTVFLNVQETMVTGVVLHVIWAQLTSVGPRPSPVP